MIQVSTNLNAGAYFIFVQSQSTSPQRIRCRGLHNIPKHTALLLLQEGSLERRSDEGVCRWLSGGCADRKRARVGPVCARSSRLHTVCEDGGVAGLVEQQVWPLPARQGHDCHHIWTPTLSNLHVKRVRAVLQKPVGLVAERPLHTVRAEAMASNLSALEAVDCATHTLWYPLVYGWRSPQFGSRRITGGRGRGARPGINMSRTIIKKVSLTERVEVSARVLPTKKGKGGSVHATGMAAVLAHGHVRRGGVGSMRTDMHGYACAPHERVLEIDLESGLVADDMVRSVPAGRGEHAPDRSAEVRRLVVAAREAAQAPIGQEDGRVALQSEVYVGPRPLRRAETRQILARPGPVERLREQRILAGAPVPSV